MKRLSVLLLILVAAAVTSLVSIGGGALATAGDSIGVCCAWNDELADGDLTYKISGGDDDAQAVVRAAVEELEVVGITLDEITGRPKPNINFKFRPGGGLIAGQAFRKFDDDGNMKACDIKISGSAFGDPNNEETVKQITKHEGLHCLGANHANFDGDLLSPTLDPDFSEISTCDIATVIAANHWKLADGPTTPHAPHETHVHCDGDAVTGGPTVSITSPDDGDTFASEATIDFIGSASDTEDNDATLTASLAWTSDIDGAIGTGGSGSFQTTDGDPLSNGSHVITASVTDSDGNIGSASITIGVGVQTILVKSIECTVSGPRLLYTVTVVAGSVGGDPVEGATVSGTRVDPRGRTFRFEGDTNADGQVAFRASRPTRGDHAITVENVVEPGFQFDETLGESSKTCTV